MRKFLELESQKSPISVERESVERVSVDSKDDDEIQIVKNPHDSTRPSSTQAQMITRSKSKSQNLEASKKKLVGSKRGREGSDFMNI